MPEDVAKFYPAEHKDPDGMFASFRVWVCIIAYNTNLVKAEDAPKSFADLLDPKWKGKIVKAHPGYSGTIMTATYQMQRDLGWGYLREARRAEHHAGAVVGRSAEEAGARRARGDGRRQRVQHLPDQEKGGPVAPVYATEGSPLIVGPTGMFKAAPNPNAARLFCNYSFTPECQQLIIDVGGLRSMHPQTKEKAGRTPFKEIKVDEGRSRRGRKDERRDQGSTTRRSSTSDPRVRHPGAAAWICRARNDPSIHDHRLARTRGTPLRRLRSLDAGALCVRRDAVRADRAAAVVAVRLQPDRRQGRVHARQFLPAVHRVRRFSIR